LPKNPIPISTRMTISPLAVALPHAERVFAECLHPVTWR
jgi:hypothetical protein